MAVKYVNNFEFPREAGFSGSAGANEVRGYMRGGSVKKSGAKGMPKPVMKKAGHGKKMEHGGQYGKGGSTHDKLMSHGKEMGYKHGGHHKMDDMDNANTQRTKKVASNQRDKEFGDQPPVKPGFQKGGKKMRKAGGGLAQATKGGFNSKPMYGRGS